MDKDARDARLETTTRERRVSYTGPTARPPDVPPFVSEREWRSRWLQVPLIRDGVGQRAQWARAYGAGNCGDLAAVAFDYLRKVGVFPIDYLELIKGDHAFLAIGRKDSEDLQDFTAWVNGFICDPWADIACPAPQFPQKWADQMRAWTATRRRYISRGNAIDPTTMTEDAVRYKRGLLKRARNTVIDIYIWGNHARVELAVRRPWEPENGGHFVQESDVVIQTEPPARVQPIAASATALHGELIVPEYLEVNLRQRCIRYEFPPGGTILSEGNLKRWWDANKDGPDENKFKKTSLSSLSRTAFSLCARAVQEASLVAIFHRNVKHHVILRNWEASDLIKFIEHAYVKNF
jgi:hypothetical protein